MKKTMFFLMLWLISLASACLKDENKSDPRNPTPIALELRITDLKGNVMNTIAEGDSFALSFLLTNNSDSLWWFRREHFGSKDFFRVFDSNNNSMGRSFEREMCNPSGSEMSDISIRPHKSQEIGVYWLHPKGIEYAYFCNPINVPSLKKGAYYTAFRGSVQFRKDRQVFVTDSIDFRYDFNVR